MGGVSRMHVGMIAADVHITAAGFSGAFAGADHTVHHPVLTASCL
jgi:hypothetical protein